jgi:hypothetical protein
VNDKPKRPKPNRRNGFVILNNWGDVWTPQAFDSETEAHKYARDYWTNYPGGPHDFQYTVVPGYSEAHAKPERRKA